MNKHLLKIFSGLFLIIAMSACEEESDPSADFLGTWKIEQITINDLEQTLSACELNATLTFEEYNLCKHYNECTDTEINDSWSLTGNTININSLLPVSFEVEHISATGLELMTYDFDSIGDVRVSQYKYVKISE